MARARTRAIAAAGAMTCAMAALTGFAQGDSRTELQPRIDTYSIKVSPDVVQAGQRVVITISGVYSAKSCRVTLRQGGKSTQAKLRVQSFTAKGRVLVPGSFRGQTTVRASCGKDGSGTSQPFVVVGPDEPRTASCDVTDYGFSQSSSGNAYLGLQVRNSSATLWARDLEIALTYRHASGRVLKTDTISHSDGIPPDSTIILAGNTSVGQSAASVEVIARCDTALVAGDPVLPASAIVVFDDDGDVQIAGEVRNTLSRTIDRYSEVALLVRDASGRIVGGDTAYLDSFAIPGAISTWDTYFYGEIPSTFGYSVEANVFVDFED